MSLITIKTFDTGIQAHIFKNKLENEGIVCYIHDENIVTLNPLYNFAVGGVKLKVNEQDAEEARSILAEIEGTPHTDEEDQIIKCPNCSSTELYSDFKSMKDPKGILSAIASFFLSVFPIYYNSLYRCKKFNTEFNAKKTQ